MAVFQGRSVVFLTHLKGMGAGAGGARAALRPAAPLFQARPYGHIIGKWLPHRACKLFGIHVRCLLAAARQQPMSLWGWLWAFVQE